MSSVIPVIFHLDVSFLTKLFCSVIRNQMWTSSLKLQRGKIASSLGAVNFSMCVLNFLLKINSRDAVVSFMVLSF